ncbi:MAG: endolytic transglycosylase MltG [Proteobacteria bacterium]|nr:endolytic transglycosylase MltG [Pseudomonadota bacterium]
MLKRLLILGSILLVMVVSSIILLYRDYQNFLDTPVNIDQAQTFTISIGQSFADINKQLASERIISNDNYFEFLARQTNKSGRIKHGEYKISPGFYPEQLLDLFVSGKVIQYSFTLVEGWQVSEMLAAIANSDLIIKTLGESDPDRLMIDLGYPDQVAEGLFFPDTYHFPKGTTDKAFLKRAYERLQMIIQEEWGMRAENLPYKTPYEALIMASIIEKETALASERKTIAGVFVRRLNKNMKLQTDPTVIYAMGKQFDGNIRKKDLNIDSPYNTYRYKGLPPTPIALVGREAIHAALNPEDGTSLYFVSKGDGSHYFSDTLSEHNKAVAKYQLKK